LEFILSYLKKKNDPELKELIFNKVNQKSHLSTLSYSILRSNIEISRLLIEFGARCYYNETDEEKDFSPIFMAVQKLSTELLELMCDHGVSLTVKNSMGMTPLMFAAENNL
jgi:ankyrin repeat protein